MITERYLGKTAFQSSQRNCACGNIHVMTDKATEQTPKKAYTIPSGQPLPKSPLITELKESGKIEEIRKWNKGAAKAKETGTHPALVISALEDTYKEQGYAEKGEKKPLGQVLQALIETMDSAKIHADKGFEIGNKVLDLAKSEFMATVSSFSEQRKASLDREIPAPTLAKIIKDAAKFGLSPTSSTGIIEEEKPEIEIPTK